MSAMLELSREAIAAVDTEGELDDVLAMPQHLSDALWRVQSAGLEAHDSPGGLVIAEGCPIGDDESTGLLGVHRHGRTKTDRA